MVYHFQIHKEKDGFSAECLELKGCRTQGDSMAELQKNAQEVLDLYLSEPGDSKVIFPLPKKYPSKRNILAVAVSSNVAFASLLRGLRLKKSLTQKEAAGLIGFKNIFAYQKLESPKTCNPQLDTMAKLKNVFPELDFNKPFDKAE